MLLKRQVSQDPVFVVYRDNETGRLGGMGSFMEIRPAVGVAEIGHIWFGRDWQRGVRATEVLSLKMRHALETLGYRRLEWKCDALNTASRRAALRLGFPLRRDIPEPHDRQGTQPGHRLVLPHAGGMARRPRGACPLARACEFRRRGPPEMLLERPHPRALVKNARLPVDHFS